MNPSLFFYVLPRALSVFIVSLFTLPRASALASAIAACFRRDTLRKRVSIYNASLFSTDSYSRNCNSALAALAWALLTERDDLLLG